MTGTINQDGSIGAIGGVLEKAQAAKESGKKLLLIPEENEVFFKTVKEYKTYGSLTMVTVKQVPVEAKDYIEEEVGIPVKYVSNVDEALTYFTL